MLKQVSTTPELGVPCCSDHERHPKGDWRSDPFPDNEARCDFFQWSKKYRGLRKAG